MTKLLFAVIIALFAVPADGMDAGISPTSAVQLKVRDAGHSGMREELLLKPGYT